MSLKTFFQEIKSAFTPKKYPEIADYPANKAVKYFTKLLILALVIMSLLFIPKLVKLPYEVSREVAKLDEIELEKCIQGGSLVKIPEREPFLVIDPSDTPKMIGDERILLTKQAFTYKIFKEQTSISLKDKEGIGKFIGGAAFFILPSIIFYAFAVFWIKYFVLILLLATIYFLLFDLTHWRLKWKQTFNAVAYASTPAIFLEVISLAFTADYLMPILAIGPVKLYLVGLIVLVAAGFIGTAYVHAEK